MDCDNTQILSVRCDDASVYTADIYISAIHPLRTLEQLGNTSMLRPAYKRRIQEARQTIGCFTVYLHFKKDRLPYMNHNFYAYNQDTPWDCEHYTSETWPKGFLYMHFCHESSPRYAQTGIIISYMQMEDVVQWRGARVGHRGEAYEAFKREHAEKLLESLDQHLPGTKACVEVYYTSTPLTYEDYTGTEQGGMYGIAKDINAAMGGRVSHKTKIPNLLFAGQNVNSHGILGTLVGSLVTCGEIVGSDKLEQDLNLNNNTNGK
jgi:all-trans-retinol 13,14-reductase